LQRGRRRSLGTEEQASQEPATGLRSSREATAAAGSTFAELGSGRRGVLRRIEWGRPEHLHAAGALRRLAHLCEVDRSRSFGVVAQGLAGAAVKRFRTGRRLEAENARFGRRDEERVRNAARCERESAGPDTVVVAVDVHNDFLFLGRVNSSRCRSRNAHFSFGALGAPSRMEAVPASQFACGPSGGQKGAGAGRDKITPRAARLEGLVAAEHVSAGDQDLASDRGIGGFAVPVRALTSE
jgi:hypothetical protein